MTLKRIFKKKKNSVLSLLALFTFIIMAFVGGFAFARATENTRWIGSLVSFDHNPYRDDGMSQYPGPNDLRYSKDIVLGLRHDGVVVWKKRSSY